MREVVLRGETDWDGWRAAARALVLDGVPPEAIAWRVGAEDAALPPPRPGGFALPRALVALAAQAIQARDPDRFALLYRLVWRVHAGEPVLEDRGDPDLPRARRLAFAVRAAAHRMRAELRFAPVPTGEAGAGGTRWLGWYAPAQFVLEANALLLARGFPAISVSILTPEASAHWDAGSGGVPRFGPGVDPAAIADDAALAAFWALYGAELIAAAGRTSALPEAEALDEPLRPPDRPLPGPVVLPRRAGDAPGALDPGLPVAGRDQAPAAALAQAAAEAAACRRCALWEAATQTVFGEGPAAVRMMLVGEQPGDREDIVGRPFVGPAGLLLDRALAAAGIDRRTVWISNAVKHFKFVPRGRRRLHQSPDAAEAAACRFWLDVELVRLAPSVLVLLGATAARTVLGRPVTIGRERGRPIRLSESCTAVVTVHPSFLLRLPEEAQQAREYAAFVADLRLAAALGPGLGG